ncbi:hypothetical protein, partial [Cytobacillus oceanisediminis]|uniref:hypothetical protein n=1 Tax=Cytobacillus oceanisediminis TaxID=665099 RepID=UPI0020407955
FDPVELDYVLKAFKSPQALYYFYFKIKKTADKHDFHRVCRQSGTSAKSRCFLCIGLHRYKKGNEIRRVIFMNILPIKANLMYFFHVLWIYAD